MNQNEKIKKSNSICTLKSDGKYFYGKYFYGVFISDCCGAYGDVTVN